MLLLFMWMFSYRVKMYKNNDIHSGPKKTPYKHCTLIFSFFLLLLLLRGTVYSKARRHNMKAGVDILIFKKILSRCEIAFVNI